MKKILLIIILVVFPAYSYADVTTWKSLGNDLSYVAIRISPGIIHAFKINSAKYNFGIATAKDLNSQAATVKLIAQKKKALIAVNGGFFTPEYQSLGLLINEGQIVNSYKDTSWWSVFFIKNGKPHIVHGDGFRVDPAITMAVQSGPRLLINGRQPALKPSIAERSAICINDAQEVLLVATENLLIQPNEFAVYLKKDEVDGGLGCVNALNLDGGSSTQIYARIGPFVLDVPGVNKIANAVVVYPK